MRVSELIALLMDCPQDAVVEFVDSDDWECRINFVENRLLSPGWAAAVRLREHEPDWGNEEDYLVEALASVDSMATTKYYEPEEDADDW